MVTGAAGGLGLLTTKILASRGATVVMAVRDVAKAEAAISDFGPALRARIEPRVLDVADLASVRGFVADVGAVDVLINNAGIMAVPFGLSPEGVDHQFATNHLGHFALTNLMLPQLSDRVVVISSVAHRAAEIDVDDLDWQRRLTAAGSTLRATGAHPGSTATHITSKTGSGLKTMVGGFGHGLVGMPPWRGALTSVYAATMDIPGNTYIGPHGPREMFGWPVPVGRSQQAGNPELARALWAKSEELTGIAFPLGRL